ncbi:MAG: DUF5107 domain-containing protein, partial [Acidobacteria bacterium]|nr:DUF5107 domain-containing protein [Acidobacteriota bacterium]
AAVYGRAAKPMRAYFDLLHRQARSGMHIWINPVPEYSDSFLRQAKDLFRQAETAAEDEGVRRRVQKARLSIDYLELLRAKTYTVRDGWYGPADPAGLQDRWRIFLDRVRSFGITSLHEGRDLSVDEQEVKSYRVVTSENPVWRLDVAPELGGRVIRMIDKRSGADVLRRVDSGERGYPDLGGLGAFVYPDFPARAWDVKWELEAGSSGVLTGSCANGLRLRRKIELREGVVHTETVVENRGAEAVEAVLQVRGDFHTGDMDNAVVRFRRQDGGVVERKLIQPEQPPMGSQTYAGAEQPDGEWRLDAAVVNRFRKEQVERALLSWTAKGPPRVTLGLWSAKRRLGPGESLRLEADYWK